MTLIFEVSQMMLRNSNVTSNNLSGDGCVSLINGATGSVVVGSCRQAGARL